MVSIESWTRAMISNKIAIFILLCFSIEECFPVSTKCGKRFVEHPEVDDTDYYGRQWPWQGVIYQRRSALDFEYACGGTLIGKRHMLTSKLCVSDESGSLLNASSLLVVLGVHDRNVSIVEHAQSREVSSIHQPTDYDASSYGGVVILKLEKEVQFNELVQPVCIWEELVDFPLGSKTFIFWGNGRNVSAQKLLHSCPESAELATLNEICANDGGSMIIQSSTRKWTMNGVSFSSTVWFAKGLLNCKSLKEFRCTESENILHNATIKLSEFTLWIKNVTNNDDLGRIRAGRDFDPDQQYPNLLPRVDCGKDVQPFKYPWIATIISESYWINGRIRNGVGTLINQRYVLMNAANAIDKIIKFVVLGEHNIDCIVENATGCNLPSKVYEVDFVTVNLGNVALIRLNEDVEYSVHIQPICLPITAELKHLNSPQYTLVKWTFKPKLDQEETVFAVGYDECIRGYLMRKFDQETRFCTFGTEIYPIRCSTSGQPLVNKVDYDGIMKTVQFGIAASLCARGYSKHINVAHYIDWIVANMLE